MTESKKSYRRASENERRLALILATQACIIEGGIRYATVRKIAAKAGVTPGLIGHYFPKMDDLLCEAYSHTMSEMTNVAKLAALASGVGSIGRLHLFVRATLTAPVMAPQQHQLWAVFTGLAPSIPSIAQVHQRSYLEFRQVCSQLVENVYRERRESICADQREQLAIALNALLDGLWLEGCLAKDLFEPNQIADIGVRSVNALLGIQSKHVF